MFGLVCLAAWALPTAAAEPLFRDVGATHLPAAEGRKFSMAAEAADLDGDGDLDLAVAREFAANALLFNDGRGCFTDLTAGRLTPIAGDHEDVAAADHDGDGDLDLVFVGEDDQVLGYHLNDGSGRFEDVTFRLPRRGTANAVVAADFDGDGDADLYVGNNGQDFLFASDGEGNFSDATARLPLVDDVTQDVAVGDLDADGDSDLVLGNEDGNRLLRNDGGIFAAAALSLAGPEETRDADLVDVDADGDLDLYLANTSLFVDGADAQDRLLLNDGRAGFTDVTATHLLPEQEPTMTSGFIDADGDGDPDLVTGAIGDLGGATADRPYRLFLNDGDGRFTTAAALPETARGNGFDIVVADFDGDGRDDLFFASRGGPDRLLLGGGDGPACQSQTQS